MVDLINILNNIVGSFLGQEVEGLGSIYFFLIFILIFSISFAASEFIPMFANGGKKYNNIRIIIALSMALFTSVSFYSIIVNQLQLFGLIAAIALGISIAVLAVMPKDKRKTAAKSVMIISILLALFVTFLLFTGTTWLTNLLAGVGNNYSNLFTNEGFFWLIVIIVVIAIFIATIYSAVKNK